MNEEWDLEEDDDWGEDDRLFKRVNSILSGAQYMGDESYDLRVRLLEAMTDQVGLMLDQADRACARLQWSEAVPTYEAVARASVEQLEFQQEYEFGDLFERALEGLDRCLDQRLAPPARALATGILEEIQREELQRLRIRAGLLDAAAAAQAPQRLRAPTPRASTQAARSSGHGPQRRRGDL